MPWVELTQDKLDKLGVFGYDKIKEDERYIVLSTPHGRMFIEKSSPKVYFDDINDAIQFEPEKILIQT